jgi:hypothetical protein
MGRAVEQAVSSRVSIWRMAALRAGCETAMASAARLKCRSWLSATKKRNCRIESGMRPAEAAERPESSGPDRGKAGSTG